MPPRHLARFILFVLLAVAGHSLFAVAPPTGDPYPLTLANPVITSGNVTAHDLGEVKSDIKAERRISAYGGIPPYTFTTDTTTKSDLLGLGLQLLPNGIVAFNGLGDPVGYFDFPVTVTDSFGFTPHTVTETFRITFVASSVTTYRFASDKLPAGAVGSSYNTQLAAINGVSPIIYTAGSITLGGVPVTRLEDVGLSLSATGILQGVPIRSGTLSFTGIATDAGGNQAADAAGGSSNQLCSVTLLPNTVVSSAFTPNSITLKTGNSSPGKDSVLLKGFVNLNGQSLSSLYGAPFILRAGRYTSPAIYFDEKGKATSAKGAIPVVKAGITSKGLLAVSITKETIASLGFTGLSGDLGVEVRVGDTVLGSSLQTFSIKPGRVGATITSLFGKPLSSNHGGAGQLISAEGVDVKGGSGDTWKVLLVAALPNSLTPGLSNAVSAKIKIGSTYENIVALTNTNGKLVGKGDKKNAIVSGLIFDTKTGKGTVATGPLPVASTGIPLAGATTARGHFPLEIIFRNSAGEAIYGVQGAVAIGATGKGKWTSVVK
jgi:hypothetical protein